jgi:hydroxypyruvate reductase
MDSAAKVLALLERSLADFTQYPNLRAALALRDSAALLHILSIGKAAWQMAYVAQKALPSDLVQDCLVLTKYGFYPQTQKANLMAEILEAGHPIPDENSLKHSRRILEWMQNIPADEDLIVLLSGGSSALFELPADGLSLADLAARNSLLLRGGLDITQINAKRKEYSRVKGGQAAKCFRGNSLEVFVLSDVPGNDPATIGSGPFYQEQKPVKHTIVGDNQAFLRCLAARFKKEYRDLPIYLGNSVLQENVEQVSRALAYLAKRSKRAVYIFGAECGIKVKGRGLGGRLSHLALHFSREICEANNVTLCAFATDGNDNLSRSAGAIVNQDTYRLLQKPGNPADALDQFDSFTILNMHDCIIPGRYTGCNVNDVLILLLGS